MADLWAVSRKGMTLEQFLAAHGYHGPAEGRGVDPNLAGGAGATRGAARHLPDDGRLGAPRPRWRRAGSPSARRPPPSCWPACRPPPPGGKVPAGCGQAPHPPAGGGQGRLPPGLRRRPGRDRVLGEELATAGTIGSPDDVCYLTVDEILGELPADPKEVVAFRRRKREEYLGLRLPDTWIGVAIPARIEASAAARPATRSPGWPSAPGVVEQAPVMLKSSIWSTTMLWLPNQPQ